MNEQLKHKLYARHSEFVNPNDRLSISTIKRTILMTLECQNVEVPCEISVLITDDRSIRKINLEFRGVDKVTDVLSFPMQELTPTESLTLDGWESREQDVDKIEPDTGLLPLGEIVLSATQTAKQAQDYGHSKEHETAYLTIHSVLHLLGYDHMDEGENKEKMRLREKEIMQKLGFEK